MKWKDIKTLLTSEVKNEGKKQAPTSKKKNPKFENLVIVSSLANESTNATLNFEVFFSD